MQETTNWFTQTDRFREIDFCYLDSITRALFSVEL